MGKTLKYVKDFDFNAKPCNYAYGGGVKDRQSRSGDAMQKVRRDVDRNEIPRQRKFDNAPPAPPAQPAPRLGSVAPAAAMAPAGLAAARPFKKGGKATAGAKKMSKVMGEYKSGKLHSGSKKGPVVKSRKQAVAIAMSEAGKSKNRA